MVVTKKRQIVRSELKRANILAIHDRRWRRGIAAKPFNEGVDFIATEFACRCQFVTSDPMRPCSLLQNEGGEMYFLDAAEILQRLKLGVNGVAKCYSQLVTACCAFHIILAEIADYAKND